MSQPFMPKEGEEDAFRFDNTPTYLFRLYRLYRLPARPSTGSTSTERVSAPAVEFPSYEEDRFGDFRNKDLLQVTPYRAAQRLRVHLRWQCGSHCNLMSWSSSLLFLLQYGLYRHTEDYDCPPLSDIYLIMTDTREFPKRTFLRDMDAIDSFLQTVVATDPSLARSEDIINLKNLQSKRTGNSYFGEYLTQGSLVIKGLCCQISLQKLIDNGLFDLCPPLERSDRHKWAEAVKSIRQWDFETKATDERRVRTAISIARGGMKGQFAFPFAIMLLALQRCDAKQEFIWRCFRDYFTDEELDIGDLTHDLDTHNTNCRMKELSQFRDLMDAIDVKRLEAQESRDPMAEIADSIQNLSVNTAASSKDHSLGGDVLRIVD